jgi:hypothetical protein
MKRFFVRPKGPILGLLLIAATAPQVACDAFEPTWYALPDQVLLHSLARPEYINLPAGYDFVGQRSVVVERPKTGEPYDFDVAVTELDGIMHVMPAGLFETFPIEPGIAVDSSGVSFDDLDRAPREGYETDRTIPLRQGWVYAVRTRRDFRGCNMYGKFEVVSMDAAGVAEIRALRNPLCNDRNLVPTGN